MKLKQLFNGFLKVVNLIPEAADIAKGVPDHPFEVMVRGHSVCTLVVSEDNKWCVLVKQFRAGEYLDSGVYSGYSSAAGMIDKGETPTLAAVREAYEETGLEIKEIEKVGEFYVSPGGTSEKSHMFIARAEFDKTTKLKAVDESEGITLEVYPLRWAQKLPDKGGVTSLQLAYLLEKSQVM